MKGDEMKLSLLLIALLGPLTAHAHGEKKHAPAAQTVAEQTAWGIAGKPAQINRTVTLDMTDAMRLTPDRLAVQEGDTGRFIVREQGGMRHEMVIGTPVELAKHAAMMARFPNMEHDEAYMVHVDPRPT